MTRQELDQQMRAALAQLETCSHVPAAGWGPSGRSGAGKEKAGTRPPGDLGHVPFARAYGPPFAAEPDDGVVRGLLHLQDWEPVPRDDRRRRDVLAAARREFEHLRGYATRDRPVGESLAQLIGRLIDDGEGLTLTEAAVHFRCGEQQVRRARKAAGRNIDDGKDLAAPADEAADDRRRRVRELKNKGHTIAQITRRTGASRSTIERDLGRRAA